MSTVAATTVVGLAIQHDSSSAADATAKPTADQLVPGKSDRLIVHGATPVEIETPLDVLASQPITSKQNLFVRNNGELTGSLTLEPVPLAGWTIELTGLVEYPRAIDAAVLATLPQVEHELVLQCSGNGRAHFSGIAPAKGSQWRDGAMANVRMRGVALGTLIEHAGCQVDKSSRFVTAEGKDGPLPAKADFEHSLPLAEALERSFIATRLGDEPLPAVHGGPARLMTPGYYGTMNVKWLTRLRFDSEETYNHNQIKRYRTPRGPIPPGSKFDYTRDNSDPNWRLRVKSVIFSPVDGARLAAGEHAISGVAFNDGQVPIEQLQVSIDKGRTWQAAQLEPARPYAWQHWSILLDLPAGERTILARAVDALGRTQPLTGASTWNPDGYAYHAAARAVVRVS